MNKLYLAGPMSGLLDNNYPAFNAEAARLRALGYIVCSPAENITPPCGSWEGYMRLAIAQLVTCDTIALLPDWISSRGAVIEHNLARELGIVCVLAANIQGPKGGQIRVWSVRYA